MDVSEICKENKKSFDNGFWFGFVAGIICGAFFASIIYWTVMQTYRDNLIKKGVAEYRINKFNGDTSFHIFQVESGKIAN